MNIRGTLQLLAILVSFRRSSSQSGLLSRAIPGLIRLYQRPGAISHFSVIDTERIRIVENLWEGSMKTIDLSETSGHLTVRANVAGRAGSVVFYLDGSDPSHVENSRPFALGGSFLGNYIAVPELANLGRHTLTASTFNERDGTGVAGSSFSVTFIVEARSPSPSPPIAMTPSPTPTFAVTEEPSLALTPSPTYEASIAPTLSTAPTKKPVSAPTREPSLAPTFFPTRSPTGAPTFGDSIDMSLCDVDPAPPAAISSDIPAYVSSPDGHLNGELRTWHKVTIGLRGFLTCEKALPNPFTDYRLDVTFTHIGTGRTHSIPGYYAADGNAANTGASKGDVWLAHFAPGLDGTWNWSASFVRGGGVAQKGGGSSAGYFDGASGSFDILETDKAGRDLRGKGLLEYVGEHHLRFAGSREWFLKAGADSPENMLAYDDFDNTPDIQGLRKAWSAHDQDYYPGNPTWAGGRGRAIIGAINYLADEGMNVFSFLTMNINGDDGNVFPYLSEDSDEDRLRIDVSKTAQWEVLFEHADQIGMYLHFKTQETENDHLLDGGALGNERKLYYRELIARFSHHLALNWNIGEENTNSVEERIQFAEYFKSHDPYMHPVVIHSYPHLKEEVYPTLLGEVSYDGASLQSKDENVFSDTLEWRSRSAASGKKWVVANDEQGPANRGLKPDSSDPEHNEFRMEVLYGNLMAGGAGVEYYFGYRFDCNDLDCEDYRSRAHMWAQTRYALEFFQDNNVPFWDMANSDSLIEGDNWCLKQSSDETIVVYLKNGGTTFVDFTDLTVAEYSVKWFNPRQGGALIDGDVTSISSDSSSIGLPPSDPSSDWVVLLTSSLF